MKPKPKRGRPRQTQKLIAVQIRLTPDEHARLLALAEAADPGRPNLAGTVRRLIRKGMEWGKL